MLSKILLVSVLLVLALSLTSHAKSADSTIEEDDARYQADLIELEAHNERRIIGGHSISGFEWRLTRPWEVQNVCDFGDGKGWIPCGCSSTIIDKHYLITAGHCLNCPYAYRVGLRFSDGHIDDQPWQEIHTPTWMFGNVTTKIQCGVRGVLRDDIGLQYLAKPIHFRYGVTPFPGLLEKRWHYDGAGIVSGWGATSQENANFLKPVYSTQLQKIREKVYPNTQCNQKILEWFAVLNYVQPDPTRVCTSPLDSGLICASPKDINTISYSTDPATFGVPNDPKSICNGDSGSPLFDPITYSILGFVSDTMSTSFYAPCGYGIDIFTKFTDELKHWARSEVSVERPHNWVCPKRRV